MADQEISTQCCIVGGGPAGMMLGLLLARAGIRIVVLEKHADFLRDFRGDTIHPSTLELMYELGVLEQFLALPHQKLYTIGGIVGDEPITIADFSHVPTHCKFVALMPQWDFLDFLADEARRYPEFDLRMRAEATALIEEGGRCVGVRATTPEGELRIRAALVVGADGRHSIIRDQARLPVQDIGAPMDVLWMRLSRKPADPEQTLGRIIAGTLFVTLNRGDYWQCAYVIPKGGIEAIRKDGLARFRALIVQVAPFFADRVEQLADWDQVKLLTVAVDRLTQWHRPGLLCIGDAAHAMSPIAGVGINLAIQDAVAAANILAEPLRAGTPDESVLAKVQARRMLPTRLTQGLQVAIQSRIIANVLRSRGNIRPPWLVRLFGRTPLLQRIPARIFGVGFRPEHVRTPDVHAA
jgi:2-polyprenyl-6-methoxyphenol hydroxylase-like FAD-dependent oxidoreductase